MKKALPVLIVLLLGAVSLLPVSCLTGGDEAAPEGETLELAGFTVTLASPKVDFPASIEFGIEARGDAAITDISLQYRMDKMGIFPVTSVVFPPIAAGEEVSAEWEWDMEQSGGLPPGADLSYWWSLRDASGREADTPVRTLSFEDGRHDWQEMKSPAFTLYWYAGGTDFAGQLVDAGEEALALLADDIGASPARPIEVYIYGSTGDLQGSLIYPQEWTGGLAFTEYSIIALGIASTQLGWGEGAMAHEMAHLVVHQVTMNGYGVAMPTWLDEGLAMYAEGPLSSVFASALDSAVKSGRLDSVQSLSSSFPAESGAATLAYAESYSLVDYLLDRKGGRDKMLQLLGAIRDGSGQEESLQRVYGLAPAGLDAEWKSYLGAGSA